MVTPTSPGDLLRWRTYALARVLESSVGKLGPQIWRLSVQLTPDSYDIELVFETSDVPDVATEASVEAVVEALPRRLGFRGSVTAVVIENPEFHTPVRSIVDTNYAVVFGGFRNQNIHLDGPISGDMHPSIANQLPIPGGVAEGDHWIDYMTVHAATAAAGDLPSSTIACGIRIDGYKMEYVFQLSRSPSSKTYEEIEWIVDGFDDGNVIFSTLGFEVLVLDIPNLSDPTVHWIYARQQ